MFTKESYFCLFKGDKQLIFFNKKKKFTSQDLLKHKYAEKITEQEFLVKILLKNTEKYRFSNMHKYHLSNYEINHLTNTAFEQLDEEAHKKENNGKDKIDDIEGYFRKIFRNKMINHLKERTKERERTLFFDDLNNRQLNEMDESEEDEPRLNKRAKMILNEAISSLKESHRVIIMMWYSGRFTQKEIAEHFGMSSNTVKTTIHRINKKMRKLLADKI